MLSPYAVTCMRLHVSKKSAGGSGAPLMVGHKWPEKEHELLLCTSLADTPSTQPCSSCQIGPRQIVVALGISHLTRLAWRQDKSCGRFRRRRWVGLCDFAPISPWENRSNSMVGSCMIALTSGSRHLVIIMNRGHVKGVQDLWVGTTRLPA